jgi:hypothetical protein
MLSKVVQVPLRHPPPLRLDKRTGRVRRNTIISTCRVS